RTRESHGDSWNGNDGARRRDRVAGHGAAALVATRGDESIANRTGVERSSVAAREVCSRAWRQGYRAYHRSVGRRPIVHHENIGESDVSRIRHGAGKYQQSAFDNRLGRAGFGDGDLRGNNKR